MVTTMKGKATVLVLAVVMAVTGLMSVGAAPAFAGFEYSCYPRGGSTYHSHWNGVEHHTYYRSYYNDFWTWSPYYAARNGGYGWYYSGWDYCY